MPGVNDLAVNVVAITKNNIEQLRVINTSTLPVRYTDKFYKDLIEKGYPEYLKFAAWNGFSVAAVCARIEPHETIADCSKLYIMTVNVLAAYRRRGIGKYKLVPTHYDFVDVLFFSHVISFFSAVPGAKLLQEVLETAQKDPSIVEVYLHVQTSNEDAKQFYLANGFIETGIIRDYYKRIEPPDCFLLKKSLKDGHEIGGNVGGSEESSS